MRRRREIVRSFVSLVGATLVLAGLTALGTFAIATTLVSLRHGAVSVETAAPLARPVEGDTADPEPFRADVGRSSAVHLQIPATIPRDGHRRLRVSVSGPVRSTGDGSDGELLEVVVTTGDPRIYVVPPSAVLTRGELREARFHVSARPDLACGEVPDGDLQVRVRPLSSAEPLVGHAPLPRLDCGSQLPAAPASVHVTEPVCGPDHAEQAQRLLEDDASLHPRRCAPERWAAGEWREPRPEPPPTRRSRPDPDADPEEDDADADEFGGEGTDAEEEADADAEAPPEDTGADADDPGGDTGSDPGADDGEGTEDGDTAEGGGTAGDADDESVDEESSPEAATSEADTAPSTDD